MVLLVPSYSFAADSSSFRLYDGVSDIADSSPLGSTSFSLNEGGETWVAYPITGSNFQIVTAPPAAVSSSSSSTTSSTAASIDDSGGGSGGGGHRGGRTNEGYTPSKPSAPQQKPTPTPLGQISDQPDAAIDEQVTGIPLPGVDLSVPDEPVFTAPADSIPDVQRERRTAKPQEEKLICDCPTTHPAPPRIIPIPTVFHGPLPSLLMLMMAFGLGYVSRYYRPGFAQIPKKSPKKKR